MLASRRNGGAHILDAVEQSLLFPLGLFSGRRAQCILEGDSGVRGYRSRDMFEQETGSQCALHVW